jgi:glycosyltransferase involved in cell wall biosynthesis
VKIAIVCDWLTGIGGAERVVLELHKLYPDAPIYTSQYDPQKIDWFKDADVHTTWLQKLPKGLKKFLPVLRAWTFSRLDLRDYDLVISSSGAEAKGIKKLKPGALHICYCHAPTHYYWSRYNEYLKNPGLGGLNFLARLGLKTLVAPMRRWDYKAAQNPDYLIANSTHIQAEIQKYYNRNSVIIAPPVDTGRFTQKNNKTRTGFVVVGRQTPYKKIDLAVAACTKLNLPLNVVGNGPDNAKLKHMAGPTITFDTNASDQDVANYLANAEACIFPGLDDFGITPVEAMAAGTPVIAYQAGGALDYVVEGKTGLFFANQTVNSLADVLQSFDPSKFNPKTIQQHAQTFSTTAFRQRMQEFIAITTNM